MSEQDGGGPPGVPKQQSSDDAGEPREGSAGPADSYRKAEEDSTMLKEEERTGEGTGSKAGEYS